MFVRDGEVAGVLGMEADHPAGLEAIQRHVFTQKDPPPEHLCAPGDPLACIYGWGFAARTCRASAQVVLGAISIRDAFPGIAVFTRAATPAGQRIICGKMGYLPYPRRSRRPALEPSAYFPGACGMNARIDPRVSGEPVNLARPRYETVVARTLEDLMQVMDDPQPWSTSASRSAPMRKSTTATTSPAPPT